MADLRKYLELALEQLDKGCEQQALNIVRLAAMDDIKSAFAQGAIFLLHPDLKRRQQAKSDLYAILYSELLP